MVGERGNKLLRGLDYWMGIPVASVAGSLRKMGSTQQGAEKSDVKHIAVLCFGAIGDLLLSSILLRALKKLYPGASVAIYVSKANAAALPLIGTGYEFAVLAVSKPWDILGHLRKKRYDLIVDTSQWARLGAVLSSLSGAGVTVGFSTKGQYRHYGYDLLVEHRNDRHETLNFLALAQTLEPSISAEPGICITDHKHLDSPDLKKTVFMHMFAGGLNPHIKEWLPEHWGRLAMVCAESGYRVLFTGAPDNAGTVELFLEKQIAFSLYREGQVRSIAGKSSLAELAFLFSRCAAVVSVNTGILHLAALSGAPTIGLHGPTNPARWGGYGANVLALTAPGPDVAYLNLGFEYPPGATPSLHRLGVEPVLSALREQGLVL